MKAKFTPGPWTIDPSMELGVAVIQDNEDGEGIAELGPQRTIENIANAKLIAAAPDLLAVSEKSLDCLRNIRDCLRNIRELLHLDKSEDDFADEIIDCIVELELSIQKAGAE